MSVTHDQLLAHWGAARLIYFPLDDFIDLITVGPDAFPPDGAIPTEVPVLFTVAVDNDAVHLFSLMRVQVGDDDPTPLIVVGCSPENTEILFCLEPTTGSIMLLDLKTPAYELVNSSFAAFVEFLYRTDDLIQSDPGGGARVAEAHTLRSRLVGIDPHAFTDPQSWWSAAFLQLTAASSTS